MRFLLAVLFLIFSQTDGLTCSCIWTSIEKDYQRSEAVFSAEVLKLNRLLDEKQEDYGIMVELRIIQRFKGMVSQTDTFKIKTGYGGGDCGFRFEEGKQYLIFASMNPMYNAKQKNEWVTTVCSHTGLISRRTEELDFLNKHK